MLSWKAGKGSIGKLLFLFFDNLQKKYIFCCGILKKVVYLHRCKLAPEGVSGRSYI